MIKLDLNNNKKNMIIINMNLSLQYKLQQY